MRRSGFGGQEGWGEVLLHVVFLTPLLASPALGIVRDACLGRGGNKSFWFVFIPSRNKWKNLSAGVNLSLFSV